MGLSQREKTLIVVALLILVPLILFRFILLPIKQHQHDLIARTETLKATIEQTNLLGQELLFLKKVTQTKPISLDKMADNILRQENLKSRSGIITEEQPKGGQRLVLKLDEINLTELTKLIYRIENSKPVVMIDSGSVNAGIKAGARVSRL